MTQRERCRCVRSQWGKPMHARPISSAMTEMAFDQEFEPEAELTPPRVITPPLGRARPPVFPVHASGGGHTASRPR